jgi:tetratricopeptide (TPR) repeat protein
MIARRVDQMGSHVFISYATQDKAIANKVCKALEARNIACWMAKRDLRAGFLYSTPLLDAIDDSLAVILILSSHANKSRHVPREIERAVSLGISLLVFRIEDIRPSRDLEYFVNAIQWLDAFEPSYASHIDRLADSVSTLLADRDEADASREHFTQYLRRRGLEAEFLIGRGKNEGLSHLDRLKLALVAIEALLDAGDLSRADEVFRTHLDDGRLLLETGDFEVGRNCVLEFVRDEQRQQECIEKLSEARLVYYLRMAGLLLLLVGDAEEAKRYHRAAAERTTCEETLHVLLNHALIWTFTGDSHKGECVARAALKMASDRGDTEGRQHSLSCLAHALSLQGKTSEAEEKYKEADALAARTDSANKTLSGPDAVLWALHLLRTERASQARSLIEHELHFARRRKAPRRGDENLPRCQWVLGCVEIAENNPGKALQCLSTAESTLRKQGALLMLPFVLHAKADAHRRLKDWSDAIQSCEQGLDLAAKRRLIPGQAELRILSGRIQLGQVPARTGSGEDSREWQIGQAMVDAECGLKLAKDHKYLWLVRDALLVLAEGAEAQDDARAAANYRREADSLTRHLLPWRRPPPN